MLKNPFNLLRSSRNSKFFELYVLHILNDGSKISLLLFLPFIVKDLNLSLTQAGLLATLANSLGIILALPSGYIASKLGGFKTLFFALVMYCLGYLSVGLAQNYFWLIPAFILAGVGFCVFHPISFALISRLSDKDNRGRQIGNFTAIGDVGSISISTLFTFLIVYIGWRFAAEFYALILVCVAVVLYPMFFAKDNNVKLKEKAGSDAKLSHVVKNKKFILASITTLCDSTASSALFVFLPFLLLFRGINPVFIGSFTAVFFAGNLAGKKVFGRFVDKYGNTKVFILAELSMAIFIVLMASSTNFLFIAVCSVILGIFTKGTLPASITMITESAERHGNFEKAFGVNSVTASLATTIAPVTLGFISDNWGIVPAFYSMAVLAVAATIPALLFHFSKSS